MKIAKWNDKEIDLSSICTIMEGANHDSPRVLSYANIPFSIDEGAVGLKYQSNYYHLYGKIEGGFNDQENLNPILFVPNFNSRNENAFDLDNSWDFPFWTVFESQRSFITSDGRIFSNSDLFNSGWNHYFSAMPQIINDCYLLFNKLKSESEINLQRKVIPYNL